MVLFLNLRVIVRCFTAQLYLKRILDPRALSTADIHGTVTALGPDHKPGCTTAARTAKNVISQRRTSTINHQPKHSNNLLRGSDYSYEECPS